MTSAPRVHYFWIRRIRLALSRDRSFACSLLCCTLLLAAFSALCGAAQTLSRPISRVRPQTELALLPDDPSFGMELPTEEAASSSSQNSVPAQPQQTRRILGIMPNFSAVSADVHLPPQSPKEKFIMAAKNSFDYSSFFIAGIQSGISIASDSYPEFGKGAAGYGRYYYHTLLDTADSNFMVAGLWPVVFRQDNRYYTLGHGNAGKRAIYAVSRVLITRTDKGGRAFNASEIIGTGSAAGISTLYYPDQYGTWTKVGQRWLTSCIIDSINFTLKEFWPDINHKFFHTK
ncbi:MAG TPA: hypothetical protein VGB69_09685 [Edaphobacter sp.]